MAMAVVVQAGQSPLNDAAALMGGDDPTLAIREHDLDGHRHRGAAVAVDERLGAVGLGDRRAVACGDQ
jgi:hypothetical protein